MSVSPELFRPQLDRRFAVSKPTSVDALSPRPFRRFDAAAILLVWAVSATLSLFLEPRHYEISTSERL